MRRRRSLKAEGTGFEDLLLSWLAELNFLFQTEGMLFREVAISTINDFRLEALLRGEALAPGRHEIPGESKGVTSHAFPLVRPSPGGGARLL